MFICGHCSCHFSRKDNLKRHGDCRMQSLVCSSCGFILNSEGALQRHIMDKHPAPSRKRQAAAAVSMSDAKRARLDQHQEPSTSTNIKHCRECNLAIPSAKFQGHLRSLQHRNNCCVGQEEGVQLIKTSFKSRIATYRLSSNQDSINVKMFMDHLKKKILMLIESQITRFGNVKVGMELFGRFLLPSKEVEEVKSFATKFRLVGEGTDVEELYTQLREILTKKAMEFAEKDSGWALQKLLHVEVNINKFNPLKASSYIPLPKEIEAKRAVLNIQNQDQKYFMWSVLAVLHPLHWTEHANRVNNYTQYEGELDFSGLEFPIQLKDISKFEQLNGISINVYGLDKVFSEGKNTIEVVGPLHFSTSRKERHVNLLLISDDYGNNHYCLIRNMSRLISGQLSKHEKAKYLCDGCLIYFYSEHKLKAHQEHDCKHISVKLPGTDLRKDKYGKDVPENILKFESIEKKLKVPFVVYADFETILEPVQAGENELNPNASYTIRTQKHVPYAFAYFIKCEFDDSHSMLRSYRGREAAEKFMEMLEMDCKSIYNEFLKFPQPMTSLTAEQEREFQAASTCHICEKPFEEGDERVRDHCHMRGLIRGAAHSACNLNFKVPKHIPIFFHNLSGFDSHLFIKHLAVENEKVDVIAQNKERYISFTKNVLVDSIDDKKMGQKQVFLKLRFLDSFRFMASSLDKLAQNLGPQQCHEVRKYFPDEIEFQLIRQKGVFPYSYVDSFSKLDETKLPSHKDFYNSLKKEHISEDDYKRAWTVWNQFKCQTLGQFAEIYVRSDTLLLASVFENFREVCLKTYSLDPAQYYTSPGLSFDAALLVTDIKLELLTDIDMVHFLKRGIRGGVSQCSVRKLVANNKFLPHYDASKPISSIHYLDATNLYGAALSRRLPTGNFRWLEEGEIKNLDIEKIPQESDTGFIFEVDLDYPEKLHDLHNELPFCPESVVSPQASFKISKLIPNFNRKERYVIHYQNLEQVLEHGLKLIKIHRVLSFNQSAWLKKYIDLNTHHRNSAQNKFEKDFFKLMNNAVFGKTMENVDKRVDVKLVTHWENVGRRLGAEALISKPNFKNVAIFGENLVAIQMEKVKVVYNKPIYVGFCVLDISKTIMYDFYYNYIKAKYGNNALLAYTDTDSLVISIQNSDFYQDMKKNLDWFDTSNFSQDNQHGIPVNQSILGKMKDEYAGRPIWEFYGTGAKAYCVNVEGELTKKAKGVPDYVSKKELSLDDYRLAVDVEGTQIHRKMSTFRSHLHDMYIELKNKVALSYADDKRYIIPGTEFTLAWGHKDVEKYLES